MRYLGTLNLIRRFRTPGERVDRFGLGDEVWEPVFAAEIAAYGPLSDMCAQALEDGQLVGPGRDRVAETRDFLQFMTREMGELVRRWHAERAKR